MPPLAGWRSPPRFPAPPPVRPSALHTARSRPAPAPPAPRHPPCVHTVAEFAEPSGSSRSRCDGSTPRNPSRATPRTWNPSLGAGYLATDRHVVATVNLDVSRALARRRRRLGDGRQRRRCSSTLRVPRRSRGGPRAAVTAFVVRCLRAVRRSPRVRRRTALSPRRHARHEGSRSLGGLRVAAARVRSTRASTSGRTYQGTPCGASSSSRFS
jgi:hypothetical protein